MIEPARSFDRAADEYERARASYPSALLDAVPVAADAEVLDLAAGTGKLTRVLTQRYRRVIAVEPLGGMRAILERVVPDAEALAGSAEAIPLADESVDAVFVAQAFHWFANDAALGEIARVLRPGGILCLVWNEHDDERESPLPAAYVERIAELHASALQAVRAAPPWSEVIARGPFGDVRELAVAHDHVLDRAGVLDNARSTSWIARRPDDDREAIMGELGALLNGGVFAIPNRANAMWTVRT
ncbi:MAG: class I SAM-dependent methyltransferase [Actinobacteria bacterium]|nr:class I SAM-dependent methyltransferase [Actinomycetota bacterium]